MDADQYLTLAAWAVLASIVCATVAAYAGYRPGPDQYDAIPAPRLLARHAADSPVDTPPTGVRGLRPAAAHAPHTVGIDGLVARPYIPEIPPIYLDGPRTLYGSIPSGLPIIRTPSCSLCHDGEHVIGAACIICGALPNRRTVTP